MKKSFIIETLNAGTDSCEADYCNSNSEERAQELIEVNGDFMEGLNLDKILTAEQFAILSHVEALVGYEELVRLAKESHNGKLSGAKMLHILNGGTLEELESCYKRQYNSIVELRLNNAREYGEKIMLEVTKLILKVSLEEFFAYARKEFDMYFLKSRYENYLSDAEAELASVSPSLSVEQVAVLLCFSEQLSTKVIDDDRFQNLNEEAKISSYSLKELRQKLEETENGFWFIPCEFDSDSRVVVTRGSSSNYYIND